MSDFKVGDEVWFLGLHFDECDFKIYGQLETFDPSRLRLKSAIIKEIYAEDKVYFLRDMQAIYAIEAYKSKEECIEAFKKRLDEL